MNKYTMQNIMFLAEIMEKFSEDRIRIVEHQEDESGNCQEHAATFLKLDNKRLGRDLELYNFMAKLEGEEALLADLLAELVLPLKREFPKLYKEASKHLIIWGKKVYDIDTQKEWEKLF